MEFAMADNTGSTIGYKKTDNGIIPVREDSSGSEIEYLKKQQDCNQGLFLFLSTSNRSYKKEIMQHLVVLYCQNLFLN